MNDTTEDRRASSSSPEAGYKADTNKPIETSEQLRIAIDQGHGKVDATDPAAAPLGTDDEAGGTPNTAAQVRLAAAHEIRPKRDNGRRVYRLVGHRGSCVHRSVSPAIGPLDNAVIANGLSSRRSK